MISLGHPKIILSKRISEQLTEQELTVILTHELLHIKRGHLFLQKCFDFIFCIHWFNPLAWAARHEFSISCEMDCDQTVFKNIPGLSAFSLGKFLFVYLSTAFFLSSLAVLCSMFTKSSHSAAAVCGIYWLFSMFARSLLRISFVPYIYLFICFVDESGPIRFLNKCILTATAIVMWLIVWFLCKKRIAILQ